MAADTETAPGPGLETPAESQDLVTGTSQDPEINQSPARVPKEEGFQ